MYRIGLTENAFSGSHALDAPFVAAGRVRPHILQVGKFYYPHRGGMETHLRSLCGELRKAVNLDVLVANDGAGTRREIMDGVRVTRAGTPLRLASAPVCPSLRALIRDSDADLVHLHLPHPTALLSYLSSGHQGQLVVTYHSDIIRQKFLGRAFWPFLKKGLERADAIIVGSPNYVETSLVLQQFRERCAVIPFGIPLSPFYRPCVAETEEIRRRYPGPLVLGLGRLVYYKGFEFLVRAMKEVKGRLIVVGDGPLRKKLYAEAALAGINDRFTILTDVEDVIPYYHAADLFVLPSIARSEAFGIVQLEAMACGKPVVNTQLDSGVTFVSQNGETGLTVPPCDAEALGRAINLLLESPALRERYGRAGQQRVAERFSVEAMAQSTLQLYEKVLSAPGH
jgi:rhamnosyl/mannosyltransferase